MNRDALSSVFGKEEVDNVIVASANRGEARRPSRVPASLPLAAFVF